jgi:large subunit ribosomal protein L17
VFSYLNDKAAVKELFTVVAPKIATRPGGYTRIIKLGIRPGDNAEKAMIELVDFNEIYGNSIASATEPAKKTRRSKSTAAPKAAAAAAVAPVEATTTEEVSAEPTPEATDEASAEASTDETPKAE